MRIDEFARVADGSIGVADRQRFLLVGFTRNIVPGPSVLGLTFKPSAESLTFKPEAE